MMVPELADTCPAVLLVVLLARRHPQLNRFQVKMRLWPFGVASFCACLYSYAWNTAMAFSKHLA